MENNKTGFFPVVAIAPGETIKENIEFLGMTQEELAQRLNITGKHLSHIINGKAPITYETAIGLETVIGPSASFWMNLENNYQLHMARLKNQQNAKEELDILKAIPYKAMSSLGWVKETVDHNERVLEARKYYGVNNLTLINDCYTTMFRKQKSTYEISDLATITWLRKVELVALDDQVGLFDKGKLRTLIPKFRALTMLKPEEFYPQLRALCANCGVTLVVVSALPKTYISGATLWKKKKPIVALSLRGKRIDSFWFTFFHEIAYLIHHPNNQIHILYEQNHKEEQADQMAADYLIPVKEYQSFVQNEPYQDIRLIELFAKKLGIAPYIIIGRLQHDGLLDYSGFSHLIPRLESDFNGWPGVDWGNVRITESAYEGP